MTTWAAQKRLDYIDDVLAGVGTLRRRDITEYFGVTMAVASKDLAEYQKLNPTLRYCKKTKFFAATQSVRNSTPERRAAWLHIGGIKE